jgi:hypothetical protein
VCLYLLVGRRGEVVGRGRQIGVCTGRLRKPKVKRGWRRLGSLILRRPPFLLRPFLSSRRTPPLLSAARCGASSR